MARCPCCARFVSDTAVRERPTFDPDEYAGMAVGTAVVVDCGCCGEVDMPARDVR